MKVNIKLNREKAVSAVIGVILMVAITVAIAATVYLYMASRVDEAPNETPVINFFSDDAENTIYVVSYNNQIDWDDINMTATNNTNTFYDHGQNGVLGVGDTIYFEDNGIVEGDIIIRFRYEPTNTLIGIYKLSSVTK